MHFRHVGTPKHKRIGVFKVVITAHRLINTKGTHKAHYRRSHTVTCVGVNVVRTKARFHQLHRRVTFHHCPLARTEHTHAGWAFGFKRSFPFFSHHIKCGIPRDWGEFTVFVVLTIFHAQQRRF
ncbi:Uncharacterised protein [Vibrio cholerae]|uniref:Uncharacterized protein n=1 Tax=Vibrio cholerae TaxID=666 RepID=A0A655XMR2_VIBCL|nr:Uncharacterised protein [Vibrio cholerae]CSA64001.1 Uncharacterised protein [Vibrio cholerae]CSA72230.1 Uncharacterised protein [Vibrio cholerae]CSB46892.1 Uncharacterised protein [Vibrio cholerae]CSB90609.1 Uncharacterised protein [Vibrio cholerae]